MHSTARPKTSSCLRHSACEAVSSDGRRRGVASTAMWLALRWPSLKPPALARAVSHPLTMLAVRAHAHRTLVNCAPNPDDCGGTGGCQGSISELAYNYTIGHGIALESDEPYAAHNQPCNESIPKAVTASGYVVLAENSAAELEATLAMVGPVAVNVAAESGLGWKSYGGGVFSGGCEAESCVIDHVVVATGYAKPSASEPGYWLVRNSWGPTWGEDGFIRLSRENDNVTYVDKRPQDGVACKPFPAQQIVGGESGILYSMTYPVGVTDA